MNQVLVVASHSDYEVHACGEIIAQHASSGDQVQVLIFAEFSKSRHTESD